MSTSHAPAPLPRVPMLALAALVLISLISVAAVRWSGMSVHTPDAPPVATRLLRFEDRPDGSIAVIDAASGRLLERVQGEQGFLRGSLRALARERRMREVGALPPFELAARADGRLTLTDPATGARLDLESFGPTNAAVFARLLTLNKNP
ncbi:MAG TPA: photosynthetic complex assembly protein PuhC [Piscinibacter sp.]|uniref:photosynthetic complex assembly protein PuhC n=1 Tax=Piscinibacter sp. TaxID=1903157 RepID=UPI001D4C3D4B|nr:photosynthetic complex assembly protein PuhC [Piscinibacter sp.]MBK7529111.1 photosynthetic complex assembly protein PuhC [Piscinibacter sp.]MBL0093862.1 photosynthetic complex assembly protein PuhC [Piscinibacter sp.]HOY36324.1 photosynthetic complex assembly protein PuhC [Piscinibacter sp.]HPG80725.1 photosynthetic complex assembly protein PuhC [Piscinibacter sp.]HPM65632.1 photosynthetic complex assembly protein PuhC [Piscinibacter sp.]